MAPGSLISGSPAGCELDRVLVLLVLSDAEVVVSAALLDAAELTSSDSAVESPQATAVKARVGRGQYCRSDAAADRSCAEWVGVACAEWVGVACAEWVGVACAGWAGVACAEWAGCGRDISYGLLALPGERGCAPDNFAVELSNPAALKLLLQASGAHWLQWPTRVAEAAIFKPGLAPMTRDVAVHDRMRPSAQGQ